eukprot:CAMPEP_0168620484 /NCGR_PEP_ID=MMETSP0449_2-20121227/7161_1 /TAXON_ID=1082188 /ORGANISM="Strombidium rassoulzadegani, Strain ras09" /LENGTH=69 /DNA_ID=CAMNT_0008661491 /DNA_START=439 /DNA_END=645 /DNA_ORIENTATION=+
MHDLNENAHLLHGELVLDGEDVVLEGELLDDLLDALHLGLAAGLEAKSVVDLGLLEPVVEDEDGLLLVV